MRGGHHEYERFPMHCPNLKSRLLANREAEKPNVQRTCLQHLYLMRCGNCEQRELNFRIQVFELTGDVRHNLCSHTRDEADPQQSQFSASRQPRLANGLIQLRQRCSRIIAKGDTRRSQRCFASVPLEESDADLLLKGSYLKA